MWGSLVLCVCECEVCSRSVSLPLHDSDELERCTKTHTRMQMIVEPEQRVADFAKAGADIISVHVEQQSTIHLHRTVNMVGDCVCA